MPIKTRFKNMQAGEVYLCEDSPLRPSWQGSLWIAQDLKTYSKVNIIKFLMNAVHIIIPDYRGASPLILRCISPSEHNHPFAGVVLSLGSQARFSQITPKEYEEFNVPPKFYRDQNWEREDAGKTGFFGSDSLTGPEDLKSKGITQEMWTGE